MISKRATVLVVGFAGRNRTHTTLGPGRFHTLDEEFRAPSFAAFMQEPEG